MSQDIDSLLPGREGIASISRDSVGQFREIGRDEAGNPIQEKVCQRLGATMMNIDGVEVHIPLQNHRVPTAESRDTYGNKHYQNQIAEGFIPKGECPLTERYAHLIGGPLAKPQKGEKACSLTRTQTSDPQWHGCPHYIRVRDKRRDAARKRAEKAQTPTPTDAMLELAREMRDLAAPAAASQTVKGAK